MGSMSVKDLMVSLREGSYTSVGGYPKFWLSADGATLSHAAIKADLFRFARATRDKNDCDYQIVACEVNWEDPDMFCADRNERIESAYAEGDICPDCGISDGHASGCPAVL